MVDDLRSNDGHGGLDGGNRRSRRPEEKRPLVDREVQVPVGGTQEQESRVLAPAVHAWLDGELPEATVRKGESARDVEFWKKINTAVEGRRRLKTPTYLEARIMDALPLTAPQLITPWYRREFVVTPAVAAAAAGTLVVVAAAVTVAVMGAIR